MKIGLVLAGGIAKGAYQAGFIRALKEELGDSNEIVAISCASIGFFGAYALAADKVELLEKMWRKIHFDSTADIIYKVWHNNFLREMAYELTDPADELKMPIYAPVLMFPMVHASWSKMEGKYHKKWPKFMHCGMYFPLLAGGLQFWRGEIAFDGGGIDCIPLLPMMQYKGEIDVIMVCHFSADFKPRQEYLKAKIPIIDYDISLGSLHRLRSFDFHGDTLAARITDGYDYGKRICSELFAKGENSFEQMMAVNERHRKEEYEERLRSAHFNWIQSLNNILHPLLFSNKPIKVHTFKYPEAVAKTEKQTKQEQKKRVRKAKKMAKVYRKMSPGTVEHPLLKEDNSLSEQDREIAMGDCDAETLATEKV